MGLLLTLGYHQIAQNRKSTILQILSLRQKETSFLF
jgi:hypothetical protein